MRILTSVGYVLLLSLAHATVSAQPTFVLTWGSFGAGNGEFDSPQGIAMDGSGDVYVVDTANARVQKFDGNGTFILAWGSPGSGDGEFQGPRGIGVDPAGDVYVVDLIQHRVQKFTNTGTFLTAWGDIVETPQPLDVFVDAASNVYLTNFITVFKYDTSGGLQLSWGEAGSGDGQFSWASGVGVNTAGDVYVVDLNAHRVQKFTSAGTFLTKWGTMGSGSGEFFGPTYVAINAADDVYVSDGNNARIQKFDADGNFLTTWGTEGSGLGQFMGPMGIAVNAGGDVYVVDSENHRVQKFFDPAVPIEAVTWGGLKSRYTR